MDLSFLDNAGRVTPFLVRLYDCQKIFDSSQGDKEAARSELTAAMSELLEAEHSPRESELIADILIGLVRQAQKDLKKAIAERLAVLENAPLRLVLQVASDEIDVAQPVLKHSPVLGEMDLIYIIKSKTPEYWRAVAERSMLSGTLVDLLAETRDLDTSITLANNHNITLTETALTVMSDLARESEDLAVPLLRRDEVTPDLARTLYNYVGEELKRFINENFDFEAPSFMEAVDDVVREMASGDDGEFSPTQAMLDAAQRYQEKGLLNLKLMLENLRRGQIRSFIAQFSIYTSLSPKTVEEVLMQQSGQGLAVACKAFDVLKPDFVSIYLLTNRVRNGIKNVDLKELTRAIDYYNQIKPDIAKGIMNNSASETE